MFLLDRLIYATNRPDEIDRIVTQERGYTCVATGQSFPGIATRLYPLAGGGFLEVAYIEDESRVPESESGLALQTFIQKNQEGYYTLVLETDDINHVEKVLQQEDYPIHFSGTTQVALPSGEQMMMRMIGTYDHLPWFIQNEKSTTPRPGYPQAAIIRTTSLVADVHLLEKLIGFSATMGQYLDMKTGFLPLANASLRFESADSYGFSYFEPKGLLLDDTKYV
ncbi:VOC family protein [Brevibacterium sp. JNUCC-42]|nr:VOC family protein [Brevibacterium sp. JNUCC-42]